MGRDSNPRYAFDVNTLSRRDRGGLNHNNVSGFHWVDVAIRRGLSARMPPIPAPNGHHNGHRNCRPRPRHYEGGSPPRGWANGPRIRAVTRRSAKADGKTVGAQVVHRFRAAPRCDASRRRADEFGSFEHRTFAAWDRASLGDLQRTIERRRKELAG